MYHVNDNAKFYWGIGLPHKLQVAEANVIGLIIILRGPKFDILWFFSISEAWFCRFVKASNDMFNIVSVKGICRETWMDVNLKE